MFHSIKYEKTKEKYQSNIKLSYIHMSIQKISKIRRSEIYSSNRWWWSSLWWWNSLSIMQAGGKFQISKTK